MLVRILSIPVILFLVGCGAPDYNLLDLKWAKYIAANPGGYKPGTPEAATARKKAEAFEKAGFALYQAKKDRQAIGQYEQALKLHATGQLYFRYANSLSNLTDRLRDAVEAYGVARELGFSGDGTVYYNMACAYSRLGDTAAAAARLNDAFNAGYNAVDHLVNDADLVRLRQSADWLPVKKDIDHIRTIMLDAPLHKRLINALSNANLPLLNELKIKFKTLYLPKPVRTWLFNYLARDFNGFIWQQPKNLSGQKAKVAALEFMARYLLLPDDMAEGFVVKWPVLILALQNGLPSVAEILIARGADVHAEGSDPMDGVSTAFLFAVKGRYHTIVKTLLDRGADPNRMHDYKYSYLPLTYAVHGNDYELASLLMKYGANPLKYDATAETTPFDLAAAAEKRRKITQLFRSYLPAGFISDSEKKSRAFFLNHYTKRKLVNVKNGRLLVFSPGVDFLENGSGIAYGKNPPKEGYWPGLIDSVFTLSGKALTFRGYFTYMEMVRSLRYTPSGDSGLYINGEYFRVAGVLENVTNF